MLSDTSLFRRVGFRRFYAARVLASAATQVQAVAVGWQMYDLTHSPLQLGLVGLAQFLPMVLLTLPAGHIADRYDRGRVASIAQLGSGIAVLLLGWGSFGGWITPGLIYLAIGFIGATRAFQQPALAALLPSLVPLEVFPQATALSSSANQAANILGPAIGGLLYGLGAVTPYGIAGLMFLTGALLTSRLRGRQDAPRHAPPGWHTVLSGLSFIFSRKIILGAISLDLFAVMLGGATAMMPVYARDILHAGPLGLGLLRGAPAAGALLLSVLLAYMPLRRHVGMKMFSAVIIFGLATIVFALSRSIPLSVGALVVLGAADVVSVVVRQSLVQLRTPDEMRGRVSAVNFLFIGTSNQFGEFESGVTAHFLGTVPAVLLGGIGSIAVALIWMWGFPTLRRLDGFDDATPPPESAPPG